MDADQLVLGEGYNNLEFKQILSPIGIFLQQQQSPSSGEDKDGVNADLRSKLITKHKKILQSSSVFKDTLSRLNHPFPPLQV